MPRIRLCGTPPNNQRPMLAARDRARCAQRAPSQPLRGVKKARVPAMPLPGRRDLNRSHSTPLSFSRDHSRNIQQPRPNVDIAALPDDERQRSNRASNSLLLMVEAVPSATRRMAAVFIHLRKRRHKKWARINEPLRWSRRHSFVCSRLDAHRRVPPRPQSTLSPLPSRKSLL
jgi:hypothetical protein